MRRTGDLRTVFRGVYVGRDVEDSLATRAQAAALILGPEHVVCDRAAAFLHGVDAYGVRESQSRPLETCVRRGGTRTRRSAIDGRERDLAAYDVEARVELQLTTPLRTALDLGCSLPRHRALGAMDAIARSHGLDRTSLDVGSRRFRGRRGVLQLRSLIPLVDPRAESPRESWIRLEIADAGLPRPEVQWWVVEDGAELWRLDLAYPDHKIAVEYDGEQFHRQTTAQIAHDSQRRRWLREHGWTVIVVTKADVRAQADAMWVQRLREALTPRTRRFRWEQGRQYS